MTRNTRKLSALLTAGLMTLGCIGATQAGADRASTPQAPNRQISYADLNLDTPADAATLYSRIKRAARNVCWEQQFGVYTTAQVVREKCLQKAVDDAVASVNNPNLAALHAARSDRSLIASTARRRT